LSIAGQPGKPVASVTRRPAPNPGRGRGFAPSRTSVRPDHRRLAARCDHRATQSRIVLAFVPALRGRLRTKFRTGIVRGVAARRRGHAGPVAVADTAHTPARVRRAPVRLANYLRARASSSRAANSCRACSQHRHLQSRSCQCTHARYGPARLAVAGRAEHLHIVEATPATSRRSTFSTNPRVAAAGCSHRNTTVKPTSRTA